ncbi:hypothetical protein [Blastococcus sp. CT_GayMR16]|uniref:hypothetical protein n=1 Tax=Blastococcus sp. CT_GayMR16 TaxID=2559607 RepID=UPI0010744E17|nr:hypothetical protein [Blastococcus sp. CT_GayMR16]TFV86172.1 hypothetical protein E4P38_18135 [Blastococcus sp. CT_GayMR16]
MIETARSGQRTRSGSSLSAIALIAVGEAAVVWAGFVLVGWVVAYGAIGGLVGSAVVLVGTDRTSRTRERVARAAVRSHRDPGPDLRAEADTQARTILAVSVVDRWGGAVLLTGVAIACVVVAVVRGDPAVAFPAPLLVVLAAGAVVLRRRTDAAADRWLADPPVPADDDVDR